MSMPYGSVIHLAFLFILIKVEAFQALFLSRKIGIVRMV